jgi:hypothetical protein
VVTGNPVIERHSSGSTRTGPVRQLLEKIHVPHPESAPMIQARTIRETRERADPVTAHRRESFGAPLESICGALGIWRRSDVKIIVRYVSIQTYRNRARCWKVPHITLCRAHYSHGPPHEAGQAHRRFWEPRRGPHLAFPSRPADVTERPEGSEAGTWGGGNRSAHRREATVLLNMSHYAKWQSRLRLATARRRDREPVTQAGRSSSRRA